MKRRDLERHLRAHGCRLIDEGANHSKWGVHDGPRQTAVPRHREIDFTLVRGICRQLGIPAPRGSR